MTLLHEQRLSSYTITISNSLLFCTRITPLNFPLTEFLVVRVYEAVRILLFESPCILTLLVFPPQLTAIPKSNLYHLNIVFVRISRNEYPPYFPGAHLPTPNPRDCVPIPEIPVPSLLSTKIRIYIYPRVLEVRSFGSVLLLRSRPLVESRS